MSSLLQKLPARLLHVAAPSPLVVGCACVVVALGVVLFLYYKPEDELKKLKSLGLPVVGKGPEIDVSKALDEGMRLYPESPYILPVDRVPLVIVPHSIINSIKSLPESAISFEKEVYIRHLAHLALKPDQKIFSDPILASIKQDLTRNISKTLDTLWDEVEYASEKALDSVDDNEDGWKKIVVYNKVLHIVALLSGRVFVGLPLSREPEWVKATISYTIILSITVGMLWKRPWWQRPILAPLYFRTLHKTTDAAAKCLKPLLETHAKVAAASVAAGEKKGRWTEGEDGQLIQWLLSHTPPQANGKVDVQQLAHDQLTVSLAAIHTTSITISHLLYDLGAYPEYVPGLREELEHVIAEDIAKGGNGRLTKVDLTKLWKMDSFIKESQRINPPILVQMRRILTAPLTLPSGLTLPVGTTIGVDAQHTNRSVPYYLASPTNEPQAPFTQFDGFRFSKLRSVPGNENRHQFVTSSTESLNFGHGTHACPGRFFASNEVKIVLAEVLLHWDVRLKGGRTGLDARPKNGFTDTNVMPDVKGEVEMRRRKI